MGLDHSRMDEDLKKVVKDLGYFSIIGLSMALSIALGAIIGHFIDEKFGTHPWFSFVGLGLGIAAAFRNLFLVYKKAKDL
ncbi:MAG: AtpZ/AtpI family protein [Thermodesulfobacteriota bacterium]|nr:AtpZ/AtpI family protein [Thermodesulfobacteriota bacterium]